MILPSHAILKEDLDPKGTKGKKEKKEGQIGGQKRDTAAHPTIMTSQMRRARS